MPDYDALDAGDDTSIIVGWLRIIRRTDCALIWAPALL
jgi:hypothetical protein